MQPYEFIEQSESFFVFFCCCFLWMSFVFKGIFLGQKPDGFLRVLVCHIKFSNQIQMKLRKKKKERKKFAITLSSKPAGKLHKYDLNGKPALPTQFKMFTVLHWSTSEGCLRLSFFIFFFFSSQASSSLDMHLLPQCQQQTKKSKRCSFAHLYHKYCARKQKQKPDWRYLWTYLCASHTDLAQTASCFGGGGGGSFFKRAIAEHF